MGGYCEGPGPSPGPPPSPHGRPQRPKGTSAGGPEPRSTADSSPRMNQQHRTGKGSLDLREGSAGCLAGCLAGSPKGSGGEIHPSPAGTSLPTPTPGI